MGYLNNNTITVDAILTKKGRELLARGAGLEITQFAVADDEIDYSLWTTTHPLGTAYYGSLIERLPLVEAVPDETQVMRYKLISLPRGTTQIPVISLAITEIVLTFSTGIGSTPIRPSTTNNYDGAGIGYTAILYDSSAGSLTGNLSNVAATAPAFLGESTATLNAVVAVGTEFNFTPADVPTTITTKLTIVGNQTGATVTIPVTVYPKVVA